jgi:hypothetical protein
MLIRVFPQNVHALHMILDIPKGEKGLHLYDHSEFAILKEQVYFRVPLFPFICEDVPPGGSGKVVAQGPELIQKIRRRKVFDQFSDSVSQF